MVESRQDQRLGIRLLVSPAGYAAEHGDSPASHTNAAPPTPDDRLNTTTATLSDEAMEKEVSPGRNRVCYLIGHLTAIHDRIFPMLGLGERLHPELDDQFIAKPDRTVPDTMASADLRKAFVEVNAKLTAAIEALPSADWLKKHAAVSDEDFAKDPLRNRIAVLQSRTAHAHFHAGQIRLTHER